MKDLDPMSPADKPLTTRMLKLRGLTLVRFRSEDEVRHGWIVSERTPTKGRYKGVGITTLQLIGIPHAVDVVGDERRYIQVMQA